VPAADADVTTTPTTKGSSVIIYPQAPTSLKLTLTYGGVDYVATVTVPAAVAATETAAATEAGFLAGNNYAYTVTLNQAGLTVSKATIAAWNTKTQDGVDAEYEYPYDIYDDGADDGSDSGLGYGEELDLPISND
jgi:hypothetical protein